MKRYGHLYERICSYENLVQAAENAKKGKKKQVTVKRFFENFETNIKFLAQEITRDGRKGLQYGLGVPDD